MGKVEIYYFSGTGNSLHVAKELQKRIPEATLIPVVSLLNQDMIETNGETIGFVFPLHAFTVPFPVKDFFKKLNPKSASYIFAIATRGGSPCRVFQDVNRYLKKKGRILNANFFIDMPNNYLLSFPIPTPDEIAGLESGMQQRVDSIAKVITNKAESHERDPHSHFFWENIVFPILTFICHRTGYFHMGKNIYADSKCTGCKTCEKVCLAGKIKVHEGRPVWLKNAKCTYCFACIHYCPVQSIQVGKSKTPEKGRYFHPEVTARDIAGQK